MESPSNGELERTSGDAKHDLSSILFSPNRDYLVRNNGDQVISESLIFLYIKWVFIVDCNLFS